MVNDFLNAIDSVTGHVALMFIFMGGAVALYWTGFPGPVEIPATLWALGTAIAGRVTAKVGDNK